MMKVKFIEAVEARLVNKYIYMKRKLLRTNAHAWFNRIFLNVYCNILIAVPKHVDKNPSEDGHS
jgi:hypothetical protein